MEIGLPRQTVWAAAAVIAAVAAWGAYQGWSQTNIDDETGGSAVSGLSTGTPLSARQATALMENTGAGLSEAQVRAIARQEVQAALRPAARETSEPEQDPEAGASAARPASTQTPAAPTPAPTPAPAEPPPRPEPDPNAQAPLF